jgi:electron transfer flavoprotein beta subunit
VLNIIVAVKQVLYPEAPSFTFRIDSEAKRVAHAAGVAQVPNPYDENALEAALRIKDHHECRVTVISLGARLSRPVLSKCLAAGADELILIEDRAVRDIDGYAAALLLSMAIRRIGSYDLVLAGRLAADTSAGKVGSGVAELLGIPSVTSACKVDVSGSCVRAERVVSDGYEVVETPLPALITVSHELGELRAVSLRELLAAKEKPIVTWSCQDIGVESIPARRTRVLDMYVPAREAHCEIVEGSNDEEAGANLALRLREAGII